MGFTLPDGGNWKALPQTNARPNDPNIYRASSPPPNNPNIYKNTGIPSSPGLGSVVDQYSAWINGQQAANNTNYLSNIGIAGLARDQQLTDAQRSFDNDLARLAEQRYRDVDLARLGLDAKNSLADSVWDTMNSQFGLDMDALNKQFASLDEQIRADRGYTDVLNRQVAGGMDRRGQEYRRQTEYINWQKSNLNTLLGFVNQGYHLGLTALEQDYNLGRQGAFNARGQVFAAADQEAAQNTRAFRNDAAARGAIGASGTQDTLGEIDKTRFLKTSAAEQDHALALSGLSTKKQQGEASLGLQRDKGRNEVEQQRQGYDYQLDQAKFGYDNDIAQLQAQYDSQNFAQGNRERQYTSNRSGLQYQYDSRQNQFNSDVANFNYDAANRDIAGLNIDSIAREYGIREADVGNALKSATQRIGLDYNNTMQQLAAQLNSGNAALQQQAQNFLMQLMAQA